MEALVIICVVLIFFLLLHLATTPDDKEKYNPWNAKLDGEMVAPTVVRNKPKAKPAVLVETKTPSLKDPNCEYVKELISKSPK